MTEKLAQALANAVANAAVATGPKAREIANARLQGITIGASRSGVGGGTEWGIEIATRDAYRKIGPRPVQGMGDAGHRWMAAMVEQIMAAEL